MERKKRLDIGHIRAFAERLENQPDGAPMPDWSAETSIGDRFAIALRLIPPDQRAVILGKSTGHLRRYETGVDIPLTVIAALAAETEIPMEWFATGRGVDRKPPLVYITPDRPRADPEDVPVQKLAFKVSAGNGALMLDDQAEYHHLPRAILEQNGVEPQNARLMQGAGESMRPIINDGDMLLVDVSPKAQQIVEGKIYVFSVGDDAFVKRLRKIGDEIMMISENRDMFPERRVPKELPFRIYGMVKWAGRSV